MGNYLTDAQIAKAREELSLLYSLPFAVDLAGTAWEQILAAAKGGTWSQKRDNRPRPDVTAPDGRGGSLQISVKTERLRTDRHKKHAADFLGGVEDLIVARPKVDELLLAGETLASLTPDQLGAKVLEYYNTEIVRRYGWDAISILFRIEDREFIYWEESPVPLYSAADYWWRESGRATGSNRNINGYPNSVARNTDPLPRATFKWTSGGKQFYVLYTIPLNADTWVISPTQLSADDVRDALRDKLQAKKRIQGEPPTT